MFSGRELQVLQATNLRVKTVKIGSSFTDENMPVPLGKYNICWLFLHSSVFSWTGYGLYFPQQGVTDYSNVWGMPNLTQFTVCFWMKSSATNTGTAFSYAVPGEDNELLIYDYNDFGLTIAGTGM